jgi:hypothetical protein
MFYREIYVYFMVSLIKRWIILEKCDLTNKVWSTGNKLRNLARPVCSDSSWLLPCRYTADTTHMMVFSREGGQLRRWPSLILWPALGKKDQGKARVNFLEIEKISLFWARLSYTSSKSQFSGMMLN